MCPNDVSPINIDYFPNNQNFSVNNLTICSENNTINIYNPNVKINKLARYVFPKVDSPIDPN